MSVGLRAKAGRQPASAWRHNAHVPQKSDLFCISTRRCSGKKVTASSILDRVMSPSRHAQPLDVDVRARSGTLPVPRGSDLSCIPTRRCSAKKVTAPSIRDDGTCCFWPEGLTRRRGVRGEKAPRPLRVSAPPREFLPTCRENRSVLHTYLDVAAGKRSQHPPSSIGDMGLALHATARRGRRARSGTQHPTCPAYLLRRCSGKIVTAPCILDSGHVTRGG